MHANLRATLAAAALIVAVPTAGIASAHEDKGKVKDKRDKIAKKCKHGGKGYEAQGILAEGSSLEQVAGADTRRRGDDRFSGTVIVEVRQGNRRGRQDKGLTSYALERVRALGTVQGDAPLPPVGSRVLLVGRLARPGCVLPTTPEPTVTPEPEPTVTPAPTATPEPTATLTNRESDDIEDTTPDESGSDEPSGSEDPSSTTPDAKASAAVIRLVVFKAPKRERPNREQAEDGTGAGRPEKAERPDGPKACRANRGDEGRPGATVCPTPVPEPDESADDESGDDSED